MDGDVYEDLRSHFTLLYETEMETCLATTKQYNRIWENIVKVCVYVYNVVFVVLIIQYADLCKGMGVQTQGLTLVLCLDGLMGPMTNIQTPVSITKPMTDILEVFSSKVLHWCKPFFLTVCFLHMQSIPQWLQKPDISHLVDRGEVGGGRQAQGSRQRESMDA